MPATATSRKTPDRPTRVTEGAVFAACDELIHAGEPLTFENVRRITRVGSPNTIYAHIRSYQKVLPERIRAQQGPQVPELPEDIAAHFVALWKQATGAARETAEAAIARQQSDLDARAAALDQTAKALERRETELATRLEEMNKRLALQDEQLREADGRAKAADTARLAASTELERARYRIAELEKTEKLLTRTLQEAEHSHTEALSALKAEQREALERQLAAHRDALAEQTRQHDQARADLETEIDALSRRAVAAEERLDAERSGRAELSATLKERGHELERLNAVLSEVRKDAARLREAAESRGNAIAELRAKLEAEQQISQAAEVRETDARAQLRRLEERLENLARQLGESKKAGRQIRDES